MPGSRVGVLEGEESTAAHAWCWRVAQDGGGRHCGLRIWVWWGALVCLGADTGEISIHTTVRSPPHTLDRHILCGVVELAGVEEMCWRRGSVQCPVGRVEFVRGRRAGAPSGAPARAAARRRVVAGLGRRRRASTWNFAISLINSKW